MNEQLIALRDAATRLGVTTQTVHNLIRSGDLDCPYPGVITLASLTRVATTTQARRRGTGGSREHTRVRGI
jgi:hypothetical protein